MRSRSSSASSINSSSSSTFQSTIQIFVKTTSGENIPITVTPSTSISDLKAILHIRTRIEPSRFKLVHAGHHLSDSDSIDSLTILPNSTLQVYVPLPGGMPPKKIRCNFKECKEAAQRIVGDCGFCQGHFCGKHRMLEDHKCSGLEDCRKESHERNANKLNSERTTVIKGI